MIKFKPWDRVIIEEGANKERGVSTIKWTLKQRGIHDNARMLRKEGEREGCHDQTWSSEGAKKNWQQWNLLVSKSAGLKQILRTVSLP